MKLVIVRPDSPPPTATDVADNGREVVCGKFAGEGRSLTLTAARRKTEWGPLITHCHSCYWKCVLFTLEQLHSHTVKMDGVSCFPARASDCVSRLSSADTARPNFPEKINEDASVGANEGAVPIGSNDMNVVIEACLGSLDLLDNEVPTVIQCLSLLLPRVHIRWSLWSAVYN